MSLSIIDLNDDCLIQIFQHLSLSTRLDLPFVCKRFYSICKNYELNSVQKRLGIVYEHNCNYPSHCIDDEDTILNLVLERRNNDSEHRSTYLNPRTSLNKFELSRPMFDQLLMRCTKLKVLSLRLVNAVDNRILKSIINHSHHLEHFTISTTTIQVTNLVWLEFSTCVCAKLKCLNLEYVDNLTDHFVSNILRKSICLENFSISGSKQLNGYFFENICNKIQSIEIRKADTFANRGHVALMSLIAGNGRKIKRLSYRGCLSTDFLNQINLIQKNFKQLDELEIGDSLDDTSPPFQRILGQTIGKMNSLKKISFSLPQLTPFTITLNSLFGTLIEINHQGNLLAFKLNGSEIADKSIELLCNNFEQLNEFHLSRSPYFARENFSLTNRIFVLLSNLKELRKLTINGLALDDHFLSLILNKCKYLIKIDLRNCRLVTNQSLINLESYAQHVEQEHILVYLHGTQVSLLKLDEEHLLSCPSNLQISFEPLLENLMDFDIIEDDGFDFIQLSTLQMF